MNEVETFLYQWVCDVIDKSKDGLYVEALAHVEHRLPREYHQRFVDLFSEVLRNNYNTDLVELTLGTVTYSPRRPEDNRP